MQIERKPSRWPYVGALIGLLIFCLTVPRYWHMASETEPGLQLEPGSLEPIGDPGWGGWPSGPVASAEFETLPSFALGYGRSAMLPGDMVVNYCGAFSNWKSPWINYEPPTIEDLLAQLSTRAQVAQYGSGDFLVFNPLIGQNVPWSSSSFADGSPWPEGMHQPYVPQVKGQTLATPAPLATAACYRFGRAVAEFSWHDLADWIPRLVKLARRWSKVEPFAHGPAVTPTHEARGPVLHGGNDRLATRRPDRVSLGGGSIDDGRDHESTTAGHAWTSPEMLLEQLERLTEYPHSARWAVETISLVTAFTKQERSRPELTGVFLRRLTQSAEEAVRLSAEVREERLRAELLRAHWGLARRLDRWTVVNDIRIASRARGRIAARGSLEGLFAGPPLAEVPANVKSLGAQLEAYEQSRDPALARKITGSQRELQSSPDDLERSLAGAVEQHYRNANVRIAVTAEMLNRFVAAERSQAGTVRERIAGTPVLGQSHTLSESRVVLTPEAGRWRMELKADGVVESNTTADGGMVRLYSQGSTDFVAQKAIVVEPGGMRMEPATVTTYNRNRLVGVTTDFDWVPVLGSVARSRAIDKYRAKRSRAKAEVEMKVAARAMQQLDEEAAERVAQLEQNIRDRFAPFEEAGVTLTTVEMTSTRERLVARLRLAGDYQLAGHTPRPRALSDSLASVQLHESALTNAAVGLGLDGRRFTAPELQAKLREAFPRMSLETPREAHENTVFQFTYNDAVSFHIADGKIELSLAVDDFRHDGRRVRGFIVHAFYVPVVHGLDVDLVRDGPLGIEGRLSSTNRARLHNVFKEVLSDERPLPLVRLEEAQNERLAGLMVTQLVLEDGWLGVAIGPEASGRVAERTRSLR